MNRTINIGIVGYGNLGKAVESEIEKNQDMSLKAIFTRRTPEKIKERAASNNIVHLDDVAKYTEDIDVLILCGGSATDLPEQGPQLAKLFNTVDSFDTHAKIPEYFAEVDTASLANNKTSIISVGWDPGLFSINRIYTEAVLPKGNDYTFWGKGVSQGHSDAIRRIKGVKDAIQYTVPIDTAINSVRAGEDPSLTTRDKHLRQCYVVAEEGADTNQIEQAIKTMPNYFADYDTEVIFVSEEELKANHHKMPHGGFVIRSGKTGYNDSNKHIIEFSLKLDSNPEFTASVLLAYARAAHRLAAEGVYGAKTVFDIAPAYLSPKSAADLRKNLL